MARKKTIPISKRLVEKKKKKTQNPQMVTLSDGTQVMEEYHNQYISKQVFDTAVDVDVEDLPPPDDEASKHQYPPPKNDKVFREKWMRFIDSVVSRSNFKEGHLDALEILCDLYCDYERLTTYLRKNGASYKSVTRVGETRKPHPEVAQLDRVKVEIRNYTDKLDLFPKKDHSTKSGGNSSEWDI